MQHSNKKVERNIYKCCGAEHQDSEISCLDW